MSTRTRFAPSPTGYLHIGGARTALYCWLHAKQTQGKFVLRIEDTDLERSTEQATSAILEGMYWLGLNWQEGPEFQSKRLPRHQEIIKQLLDTGHAYKCYCSKERLDHLRESQMANKQKPRYDGHCRSLTEPQTGSYVIRFKTPTTGSITFNDLIRGEITTNNSELDDLIIARSDGSPTYNLCATIDDMDMQMTHIIRGDDHINNTPRQIHILRALNADLPTYAHVPMILGDDGSRLSKRHGAVSVLHYREMGYLPEAVINYIVRLGWSHGDQEIFSIEQLTELFKISDVNRAPSTFNTEKLNWLNQQYLSQEYNKSIEQELVWHFEQANIDYQTGPALSDLYLLMRERAKNLKELVQDSAFFYQAVTSIEPKAVKKHLKPATVPVLEALNSQFEGLHQWQATAIQSSIEQVMQQFELGMGKVGQPLRVAITGTGRSPDIDKTVALLGRQLTIQRLKQAIDLINSNAPNKA